MTAEAHRYVVRGTVQGVGYRAYVQDAAERLGMSGWVRNRRDGSVEIHEPAVLAAFREACRKGPSGSRVTAVEDSLSPGSEDQPEITSRFSVLPTL